MESRPANILALGSIRMRILTSGIFTASLPWSLEARLRKPGQTLIGPPGTKMSSGGPSRLRCSPIRLRSSRVHAVAVAKLA
jgi:hypothetical protein